MRTIVSDQEPGLELLKEKPPTAAEQAVEELPLTEEEIFAKLPEKTQAEIVAGRGKLKELGAVIRPLGATPPSPPQLVTLYAPVAELPTNAREEAGYVSAATLEEQEAGRNRLARKATDYKQALHANAVHAAAVLAAGGPASPSDLDYHEPK